MNIFKKIYSWFKRLLTRPGLDKFLQDWLAIATAAAARLAEVNSNAEFHEWKDQLFQEIKLKSGQVKDNWIAILIHLAWEQVKAQREG